MRKSEAGFTLVETLVALALVATVSLLLFEGMRFTNAAWRTRDKQSDALTAAISAGDTLREIAERAIDPALQQNFVGSESSLQLITVIPTTDEATRRAQLVVISREGDQLIAAGQDIGADSASEQHVLVTGVERVRFRYLNRAGTWEQTWDIPNQLPLLIEIRMEFSGLRHWPAIVVAPGPNPVPD